MASLVAQLVKNLPAMQETCVWSWSWADPLEKGMATQLQYSCLGNLQGRSWRAAVHGITKSRTWLSDSTHTYLYNSANDIFLILLPQTYFRSCKNMNYPNKQSSPLSNNHRYHGRLQFVALFKCFFSSTSSFSVGKSVIQLPLGARVFNLIAKGYFREIVPWTETESSIPLWLKCSQTFKSGSC